jgi:hypothetical protein
LTSSIQATLDGRVDLEKVYLTDSLSLNQRYGGCLVIKDAFKAVMSKNQVASVGLASWKRTPVIHGPMRMGGQSP